MRSKDMSLPYGWDLDFEDAHVGFVLFEFGAVWAYFDLFEVGALLGVIFYAPADEDALFGLWVVGYFQHKGAVGSRCFSDGYVAAFGVSVGSGWDWKFGYLLLGFIGLVVFVGDEDDAEADCVMGGLGEGLFAVVAGLFGHVEGDPDTVFGGFCVSYWGVAEVVIGVSAFGEFEAFEVVAVFGELEGSLAAESGAHADDSIDLA